MATPQKVFYENMHFWILPLILVFFKFLFDMLPKPVFFGLFAAAVVGIIAYDKYKVQQSEKAAQQLEKSADNFLDELAASEKAALEKAQSKKAMKEKQKKEKLRAQEMKRAKAAPAKPQQEDEDEDEDDMLDRMAEIQSKKKN